jgi:hypothetical protein
MASVRNANRNEVVRKLGPFREQTGFGCRKWLAQLEHLCEVKELLDDRLAVFKECLEGGALIWWQNLDQDVKEDWEETRQAFVEEYVGTIAYQLELEARWNDLEEQTAQNVAGFARDYNLLLHEMEEKPALSQQIRKFEQKLLPAIREKLPARNFDTLEDLIQTAKVVESKLVQSGKSLGATNLTKGILQFRPEEQYMIGIHESMQRPKQFLTIDGPLNKRTKFPPEE